MKHFKRFISVILALLMIISGAPLTVFADDEASVTSGNYVSPYGEEYNLHWEYNDYTDTLYLDGEIITSIPVEDEDTGDDVFYLPLYIEENGVEYLVENVCHNIVFGKNVKALECSCLGFNDNHTFNISFESGTQLERIGVEAFYGYHINRLEIPNTVTYIEGSAFESSEIEYIRLPRNSEQILTMDNGVFREATIKVFDFNRCNINTIPAYTFYCAEIYNITLPSSIQTISSYAFYSSYIACDLTLPESLELIGSDAFRESRINKIVFPSGIKTISSRAFKNCTVYKDSYFSYETQQTTVQKTAFEGSNITVEAIEPESEIDTEHHSVSGHYTGKTAAYDLDWSYNADTDTLYLDGKIIGSVNIKTYNCLPLVYTGESGLEKLWAGSYHHVVFSNKVTDLEKDCLGITSWSTHATVKVVFEENSSLEYIAPLAFQSARIKNLVLPDSVYCIDNNAFKNSEIEYIKLPHYTGNEEVELGDAAFYGCKGIQIDFNGFNIETIKEETFKHATLHGFRIPNTVKTIESEAFCNTSINSNLIIPDSVETLYEEAFSNAKIGGNLTIEKDFENLDSDIFYNATFSGNVVIADNVSKLSEAMFESVEANKFYIGKGIKTIPSACFQRVETKEGIELSEEISNLHIESYAFASSSLETFNFSSSISSVESNAFNKCKGLKSITADNSCSIEAFPEGLFSGCVNLKSVEVPGSVKTLNKSVFSGCSSLSQITFKSGSRIEDFGDEAFMNMTSLKSFEVPSSVKRLGASAFEGCTKLESFTFESGSQLEEIGICCFKNSGELLNVYNNSLKLPACVKNIGSYAFYGFGATVEFEDNSQLETIGSYAFAKCPYFSIVSFDKCDKLREIGSYAFSECPLLYLVEFNENGALETIGSYAFSSCSKLEEIDLPEGLKTISNNAFYNCTALTSAHLPSSLKTLGDEVFYKCTQLTTVNIPQNITQIPNYAFANDAQLEITIPSNITSIGNSAFYECAKLTAIPKSVINIGSYAFSKTGITSVDFSNTGYERTLGAYAFEDCLSLTSVNLYNTQFISVGTNTFCGCSNLASFSMPDSMPRIPDNFLYGTKVSGELDLPNDIDKIGSYAFYQLDITAVDIPYECTSIGDDAFAFCRKLESIDFDNPHKAYSIGKYAFYYCESLTSLELPNGITAIGAYAFSNTSITTLSLPETLKTISEAAFSSTDIVSINLPDSVTTIDKRAFNSCESLVSVIVSENSKLKTIGSYAFSACTKLRCFDIPKYVNTISTYAFFNCKLDRVVIPYYCRNLEKYAFANNPLKIAIVLNSTMSIYPYSLFYDANTQKYNTDGFIFGYSSSTAYSYALNNNIQFTSIDSVEDPESIETPNYDVSHTFGSWKNGTWHYLYGLNRTLYIEGSGSVVPVLKDSNGLESSLVEIIEEFGINVLYLGDGITAIPDNFLYTQDGLGIEYVRLPNSLKSIGEYAFANTSVIAFYNEARASAINNEVYNSYIPQNVTSIGEYAFAYTDSLEGDFYLPRDLTEIPEGLFYNSGTTHVEMFGKVTKIGKKAFAECSNLLTLYVPCSVEEIYTDDNPENNAFGYCDGAYSTNLWVIGRNGSAAYEYCTENNIHFSDSLGRPYRSGKFTDYNSSATNGTINWEYYIEDNQLVLSAGNNKNIVDSSWQKFYEYNPDTDKTELVVTLMEEKDLELIDLKPDKVAFDKIYEFTAPDLLSIFNPKEIEFYTAVRKVGLYTFANCTRIEELYLPASLYYAGEYCFANCSSLKKVRLGYGISTIANGMFSECSKLESVDLGNIVLQSIGERAFYNCNALKFVNLSNQTGYNDGSIGAQAFYNCVNLQEIIIPDNIRYIEPKAFYNCVQAQKITLSGNVTRIEKDAFANLFYCESITINSEVNPAAFSSEKDIFANLGAYTNGIELNIGNSVENVDFKFFEGLNVTSVNFGSGVKTLRNRQYLAKLKQITASEDSDFSVKNNCLYSGNCLVLAPQALTQITLDPETKGIDDYALYGTGAKSITLPDGVNALGEYCFAGSKALIGITLSDSIIEIPEGAFSGCEKLRLINLPESTFVIKRSAFENCTSLISAVFNNSISLIAENAFKGCSKLEGLAFPENLSSIASGAFENCTGLKYVYIWNTTIGQGAFANDEKLNIFTPVGTDAYRYAREFNVPYSAYIDEELFFDEWAIKIDALAGYLGYCEEDGHGNIQYLTVYEADCENDGYVIGVCEYCSEILEEIHIDAYGHQYKTEADIPATATTRGIKVCTCERCNRSITEYTAPLDESFEIQTHTVCGTVELSSNKTAAQGIAPAKNASIVIDDMVVATTDSDGRFSFELETGAYQAQIKYAYGFTRNVYFIVNNKDVEFAEPIIIIGCDFSKDGIINDEDIRLFQMIISAKKDDPSYLSFVDLNADGYINAKDLLYIKALNGLEEQTFKYPLLIIS